MNSYSISIKESQVALHFCQSSGIEELCKLCKPFTLYVTISLPVVI